MEVFMLGSVETQDRCKTFLEKVGRLDNELVMEVESEVTRAIPLDAKEWDDTWAPAERRETFKRIIRNEYTKRACTHYFTHGLMALVEGGSVNEVSIGTMMLSPCGVTQQFFLDNRRIPLPTGFVFPIETDRENRRTALDATKKFVVLAEKLEWYWGRYPSMLWLLYMGGKPGESALEVEEEALFKVFCNKRDTG
jgi:hypothetical protein